MKTSFAQYYASSAAGLQAQSRAAVDDALGRGAKLLVLGLDNLPALDDAAISATIAASRRLREAGGSVRLVTQRASHRERLSLTGLDRVFRVFASAEDAVRPNGE